MAQHIPILKRHPLIQAFNRLSRPVRAPDVREVSLCAPDEYRRYFSPHPSWLNEEWSGSHQEIPRIIHCCYGFWNEEPAIPKEYVDNIKIWKQYHPEWPIYFWDKSSFEHLLHSKFPQFLDGYSRALKPVQQADFARYLLVYACGGFYMDMDIACLQPLTHLLAQFPNASMLVSVECELTPNECQATTLYPIRHGVPELPTRIANYFIGSRPGHSVILNLLNMISARMSLPVKSQYDILYTTGGDPMTEIVHQSKLEHPDMVILSKDQSNQFLKHFAFGGWRDQTT